MKEFILPDLGEGLQEAEIVTWHVGEGDHVVADQPLVSVETDKAVVEVPSPWSGRIGKLLAEEGVMVKIGTAIVAFDETEGTDAGAIAGEISAEASVMEERATSTASGGGGGGIRATPAVRAMARKMDVDLAMVSPSGPNGTVTAQDVERVAKLLADAGPLEPLRGVRRAMARRMTQSHGEVAPATLMDDADIDGWKKGGDITLRLIRAVVAGAKAEPALNAWYDSASEGRRLCNVVHLGIAVDTAEGLFVPVLQNADSRSPEDLRAGLEAMKKDVKNHEVPPSELRGATFSLSNFGTLAGRYAVPVVVPPQVGILAAGVIGQHPRVVSGELAVRRVIPLSLSFDHRAVTGGEAARFLAAVIGDLEKKS